MDEALHAATLTPFAPSYRAAGVLLHVTALPTPYGIGDLGPTACWWIDRLAAAGQSWWQVLPLGPAGSRFSPYEPLSSFAGNSLLLSPDWLVEDGLLTHDDCRGPAFASHAVAFEEVVPFKQRLLDRVWEHFQNGRRPDLRGELESFAHAQRDWLEDFALFMALKAQHGGGAYTHWPPPLVQREPAALAASRSQLAEALDRTRLEQFLIARQWSRLREHARARGVRLMGDLPIFVSMDSCDAWAHREVFLLDEEHRPLALSGVPPDYFCPEGQLWGNPLYNWPALRETDYQWWVDRLRAQLSCLDLVRLDHFRGFEASWHVRAGATSARDGEWHPGPGADFFQSLRRQLGGLPFVAEDLGMITDPVRALRDQFFLPGMRVLQFAFEDGSQNPFLPHNYVPNTVVYTGTHDNDTTRGWYEALTESQREVVDAYLGRPLDRHGDVAWEFLRLAWMSVAALAIVPLQDLHNLDTS
ncbi:MAG: 4-alpha-glucanotransferase, partial [Planctomycetales bacterium]